MPHWRGLLTSVRGRRLVHPDAWHGGGGPGPTRKPGPLRGEQSPRPLEVQLPDVAMRAREPELALPHTRSPAGRHWRWNDELARLASAEDERAQRLQTAWDFFRASGKTLAKARELLAGVDLAHPVEVVTIAAGTELWQLQAPGADQGDWYSLEPVKASRAGISKFVAESYEPREEDYRGAPPRRVLPAMALRRGGEYVTTARVAMLRSVAARVWDTWSLASRGTALRTEGGIAQYYSADKRHISPTGRQR